MVTTVRGIVRVEAKDLNGFNVARLSVNLNLLSGSAVTTLTIAEHEARSGARIVGGTVLQDKRGAEARLAIMSVQRQSAPATMRTRTSAPRHARECLLVRLHGILHINARCCQTAAGI